jgi:hypothetical protein
MNRITSLELLKKSIDTGLNANLTPEDCKELVYFIRSLIAKRKSKTYTLLDKMETNVSELFKGFLDEILEKKV